MFFLDVLDSLPIKQEDDLMNNCSLLNSPSLSHPMFDSIIDHNQFWHSNQIHPSSGYYLPVNSSPYDHQSTSDIDNSNSSIHDHSSKTMNNNNNNGQSRKDKSLGLLCQR